MSEIPRIGVLNNLRAGRGDKRVSAVLSLLREHPEVIHEETESAARLPIAIARLARRDLDVLVVNGGDGTLQHTLTELLARRPFGRLPLLAPLRGGRTNMAALDLGADRNPVRGLAGLLADARAGRLATRLVHRPVLRIELDRGHRVEYGMFFGVGMIRRAIARTHDLFPTGRSQGVLGAGLVTLGLVAKAVRRPREGILEPDKVQVRLDGESVAAGEFYLAIATSLERLFWRINPFWGEGEGPVRITCISSRVRSIPRAALGVLRGRPGPFVHPGNGYTSARVKQAQLLFHSGFTIDGEIFPSRADETVTLGGDERLRFLRA